MNPEKNTSNLLIKNLKNGILRRDLEPTPLTQEDPFNPDLDVALYSKYIKAIWQRDLLTIAGDQQSSLID